MILFYFKLRHFAFFHYKMKTTNNIKAMHSKYQKSISIFFSIFNFVLTHFIYAKTLNHKNLFLCNKLFHSFFILTWFWVIRKLPSTFSFIIQLTWPVLMNWQYQSLVNLYFLHFLCA